MNKKFIYLLLILCFIGGSKLIGQDDFEAWQRSQEEQFRQYKSEQDKAFVEFLEQNWQDFAVFKGEIADTTPKPEEAPVAEKETSRDFSQDKILEKVQVPVFDVEEQQEKNSMIVAVEKKSPQIEIKFWGLPLVFNYQPKLEIELEPLDQKAVADFWYVASNSNYELLLKQVLESRDKMRLNDWGYCLLLNEIGKKLADNSQNTARLFVWFMLTKSGYETKVGYNENSIYLLLPSANKIYGVSFIEIEDKRFYAVSFDSREKIDFAINTYEGKYPKADALIDLGVSEIPSINKTIIEKELTFRYDEIEYKFPVRYDQNASEFFRNYPQTDIDVYFNAPLSSEATYSLITGLKPILEGRNVTEAANVILRFVQTAFQYKTDGEQFGREKSFFADESLFYPYNDCEDRSIIFSFLIRQILELNVIGLDYPGHIATAVDFQIEIPGDFVTVDGRDYIICDPTYINADLGMAMPQFKNVQPKIIAFGN